jgi:hypothetical protein
MSLPKPYLQNTARRSAAGNTEHFVLKETTKPKRPQSIERMRQMILDENTRPLTTTTEDDLKMNSDRLLEEAGLMQFMVSQ